MGRSIKKIAILISLIALFILPYFVFAESPTTMDTLNKVAADNGPYKADSNDPLAIAGKVVSTFLGLLGVIFVVLIIYAGYHWMTAAGDESKVEKAQDTIKRAIIGLIITVGAYAIWNVILTSGIL